MMYTTTGIYVDTVQTSLGCDSIVTLDLTINNSAMTADTVTACDSYTWMHNSMLYTTTGIYVDTVQTSLGCDSIVTLDLMIDTLDLTIAKFNDSLVSNDVNATSYQWINCDSNNAIIPGATSIGFKPDFDGNYAVILTKGACSDTSACENVVINSINSVEQAMNAIQVYPNPTNGILTVRVIGMNKENSPLRIFNITGQLIEEFQMDERQITLDMSSYNRGLYFIKYGKSIKKVILSN